MRRRTTGSVFLWVGAVSLAAAFGCGQKQEPPPVPGPAEELDQTDVLPPAQQGPAPPLPKPVPAEDLRQTDVLPYPGGAIVPGRNYVYCPTFQLAWSELATKVLGEPIRLSGSPQMVADLAAAPKVGPRDLPPGAYLVKAGWVKDGIVDQILAEMQRRFPKATLELPEEAKDPAAVAVAYAYLQRSLPFGEAFDVLPKPLEFTTKDGKTPVRVFGYYYLRYSERNAVLQSQVTILDHVDNDNFVLRLNTTVQDDELVLAKVPPEKTLQATLDSVLGRAKKKAVNDYSTRAEENEPVVVPVISVGVSRRYKELEGHALEGPKWSGVEVSVALQRLLFRLDQTGARLESDAYIDVKSAAGPEEPRRFIFDKPFLVCLKRKASELPYFAVWVENAEVLEKAAQ